MPKIIENPTSIIIEHAKKILEQQGYEALSMRAIAKSCGIATGTIYNYFPTKRELLVQMMADYWESNFKVMDEISESGADLYVTLKKIFELIENFVLQFQDVWTGMRQESENSNQTERTHHNHDYMKRLAEKIEMLLIKEQQLCPGDYHYPLSAKELAWFIVQNQMMICHMKHFSYSSWEQLLRKMLQ
jgi:AcrR family transcriptional regulator